MSRENVSEAQGSRRSKLRALGFCVVLAACQTPRESPAEALTPLPDPSPVEGVGYVLFDAPVTPKTSALLIEDMDKLQARGAREIDLGINSLGGEFD